MNKFGDSEHSVVVTVGEAIRLSSAKLRDSGIAEYGQEARLLAGHVFALGPVELISNNSMTFATEKTEELIELIERRICGEPVGRIIGEKEICGLRFQISKDTLEPRHDTEILINSVLEDQLKNRNDTLRILDIGTGTGIIIVSLLRQMPNATGIASDISVEAIKVARKNAELNKVEERVSFLIANWSAGIEGKFDIIVSNPPYIKTDVISSLAREVKDHDPLLALDGGRDGLDAYRAIFTQCLSKLVKNGRLYLEIGYDQAQTVELLGVRHGWKLERLQKDLNSNDRVVVFRPQSLSE